MLKIELKRYLLITLGTVSLSLGVVGIFLPVLPTTPLLLATAYCYVRSSPSLYRWLTGPQGPWALPQGLPGAAHGSPQGEGRGPRHPLAVTPSVHALYSPSWRAHPGSPRGPGREHLPDQAARRGCCLTSLAEQLEFFTQISQVNQLLPAHHLGQGYSCGLAVLQGSHAACLAS
jgi:hypothetical protein